MSNAMKDLITALGNISRDIDGEYEDQLRSWQEERDMLKSDISELKSTRDDLNKRHEREIRDLNMEISELRTQLKLSENNRGG